MNTELIEAEFDEKDLHNRPGSYGKLLTYISYPAYVRRMNQCFDYDWSAEVTQLEFHEDEVIALVKVTAGGIVKMQAGGKRISRNKQGVAISLGDDCKSAITTAFKKACSLFGIGVYLSEGDDDEVTQNTTSHRTTTRTNGTISEAQLKLIKEIRTERGIEPDAVCDLAQQMFSTRDIVSLNKTQASTLISALKNGSGSETPQNAAEIPF